MNIAIFSPSQNSYSETFIQAHKNYLKGQVFYYYGSRSLIKLEGSTNLVSKIVKWRFRILRKLNNYSFSYVNNKSVLASLKKNKIDVVLIEYGNHAFNLIDLFKESDLPLVVHFHGYDASLEDVVKKCKYYKEVFASASFIIAVSKKMESLLLSMGCPSEKLVYNVYGPQKKFEAVEPNYSKKQFISIGRFVNKKAPYYTILAFEKVLAKYPDASLLMAGNGVLLNMCKNLVVYLQIESQVKFLGVIKPEAYMELLSESLAYVQHSITAENGDMEGTPLAILEASVAGLPVLSTNHAGIPDVIKHNETGLLCEEHDVAEMAKNMVKILEDYDFVRNSGSLGKQNILSKFSFDRHIQVLNNILEEARTNK